MILSQLVALKDAYKSSLESQFLSNRYAWTSLEMFVNNWQTEALDFAAMYARSFENTLANPLWEGREFFPKKAMQELIERDEDLVRKMFKELFSENLDIEGRVDRFVYHCDALREDMMRDNPKYQKHYHSGYKMISVYLAFKYPMQYCVFEYPEWKQFMQNVGAKPVPEPHEIGRFFKVMRTIWKIISKDSELLEMHKALRGTYDDVYQGDSLLMVWELYRMPTP